MNQFANPQAENTSDSAPDVILAAGGLVWKRTGDELQVAVIYRTRHGEEWCLPKGKLKPNETVKQAALREVHEETGCRGRAVSFAGVIHYMVRASPKVVMFWNIDPIEEEDFSPSDEVRDMKWVAPSQALSMLTHEKEQLLLIEECRRRGTIPPPKALSR